MSPTATCKLSVVLPFANERDNLAPLLDELERELRVLGLSFEVICVDDGSNDGGWELLRSLQSTRPWLRAFQHRVNCGQSAGYCTGFKLAAGELVLTMDADRQHDPADIKLLLRELRGDVAAVCGIRQRRQDNWVRRASSRIANGFAARLIGAQVSDAGCTFRLVRRMALAELPAFNGLHRFLPILLRFQGFQVVEVPISHRNRTAGKSKYGIGNRLWRGILDCLAIRWYRRRCFPAERLATVRTAQPTTDSSSATSEVLAAAGTTVTGEPKR